MAEAARLLRRCDQATLSAIERSLALTLKTSAVLTDAMRDSLTPSTPSRSLRACQAAVLATLELADLVDRRAARNPDEDSPEAVRADAELRALARALRDQAQPFAADLEAALFE